jgi:hypothetical protein
LTFSVWLAFTFARKEVVRFIIRQINLWMEDFWFNCFI